MECVQTFYTSAHGILDGMMDMRVMRLKKNLYSLDLNFYLRILFSLPFVLVSVLLPYLVVIIFPVTVTIVPKIIKNIIKKQVYILIAVQLCYVISGMYIYILTCNIATRNAMQDYICCVTTNLKKIFGMTQNNRKLHLFK